MYEPNWTQLNAETSYYLHNQYLLKKKKIKGYFVYTVWDNNVLKYNSYNEYQFLQLAWKICHNEFFTWKG
jgi:hypothetical protein